MFAPPTRIFPAFRAASKLSWARAGAGPTPTLTATAKHSAAPRMPLRMCRLLPLLFRGTTAPGGAGLQPAQDPLVEVDAHGFQRYKGASLEASRLHSLLTSFGDAPILPVDGVPHLDRVAAVEVAPLHRGRLEIPFADDLRPPGTVRKEELGLHVVRQQVQVEEIRIGGHEVVAAPVSLVQAPERRPIR